MKREAAIHSKTGRLARKLGLEHWGAIGLLEALWHLTAREAPGGDIGKLPNEDIAYGVWWQGSPDLLIGALVECRWLDVSDEHRLLVHDWRDHADDGVHQKLFKARKLFADGSIPSLTKLSKSEREEVTKDYERLKALESAKKREKALALPCQASAKPVPVPVPVPQDSAQSCASGNGLIATQEEEESKVLIDPQVIAHQLATELHAHHPEPCSLPLAKKAAERALFRYKDQDPRRIATSILKAHRTHCELWVLKRSEIPNSYVPHVHIWLEEERYLQKNSAPIKIRGQPRDKIQAASEEFDRFLMRDLEDAKQQQSVHKN